MRHSLDFKIGESLDRINKIINTMTSFVPLQCLVACTLQAYLNGEIHPSGNVMKIFNNIILQTVGSCAHGEADYSWIGYYWFICFGESLPVTVGICKRLKIRDKGAVSAPVFGN